ncbi:hypothetical protein B0H15DRAFT_800770 [Mycena belliarum]|uniref:Uncharacterized protein n=1 Tax=Mycena belliarum TaxID=1033014 RepID=A0AAD6U8Q8_9AGAR|nr:hypothetical protein B0H15DRAFT_806465 [Mycena belliae]KAJ7075893.1 hypothetical protein B0H15DRAFT_805950 [Mycena belliae]KAJ7088804.1 hypothetical protein B0H15DRAFT_800770 [Mycena belliae]
MNDPGGAPEWRGRVLWWLRHVERRAAEAIDAPAPPPAERRSPEPFPKLSDALARALLFLEAADFKARAALARLRPLLDAAYPALAHPLLLRGAAPPPSRKSEDKSVVLVTAWVQDGVDPVKAFLPLEHGFLQLDKHKLVLGTLELECGTPMEQFVQAEGGGYWEDLGWSVNVTIGEGKQMGLFFKTPSSRLGLILSLFFSDDQRQLTLPPGFILSLFLSDDQRERRLPQPSSSVTTSSTLSRRVHDPKRASTTRGGNPVATDSSRHQAGARRSLQLRDPPEAAGEHCTKGPPQARGKDWAGEGREKASGAVGGSVSGSETGSVGAVEGPLRGEIRIRERLLHLNFKLARAWIRPRPCDYCRVKHQEKFDYEACGGRRGIRKAVEYYLRRLGWPIIREKL